MAAPPIRAKSAAVSLSDYEGVGAVARFGPLAKAIAARAEKDEEAAGFSAGDVTARGLAQLTGQLRLFGEVALGRGAQPPRPFAKIPHRLFSDFEEGGGLDVILCACLRFKASSGLRRLDFGNEDKQGLYMELLRIVHRGLKKKGLLPEVRVFIAESVGRKDRDRLKEIARKRGEVVEEAADATHIVHADPEGTTPKETDGTDYCRTVEIAAPLALVHWWYHPDSYDSWIPVADVQGDPEPPQVVNGPQHVHVRWLDDTQIFNEWMNELDYDVAPELRGKLDGVGLKSEGRKKSKKKSSRKSSVERRDEGEMRKGGKKRKRTEVGKNDRDEGSGKRRDRESERSGDGGIEKVRERDRDRNRDRHRDRVRDRPRDKDRDRDRDRDRERHRNKFRSDGDAKKSHRRQSLTGGGEDDEVKQAKRRGGDKDGNDAESGQTPAKRAKSGGDGGSAVGGEGLLKVRINVGKRDGDDGSENLSAVDVGGENGSDAPSQGLKVRVKMRSRPGEDSADGGGEDRVFGDSGRNVDENRHDSERIPRRSSKSSKKRDRRSGQPRNPGVSFVANALPIAESDIRRIRNVSMDTPSAVSEEPMGGYRGGFGEGGNDSSAAMDINEDEKNGILGDGKPEYRATAVAAEALSGGKEVGAPVSAAGLIESLPAAAIRIPAQSRWFRMDSIHDLEKRSLPEFFSCRSASKTGAVYKTYRDFMIDTWRLMPTKYLTATSARRHLAGDVCTILRVHAFLEHWGLINFGIEPASRPHHTSIKGVRDDVHSWNSAPISEQPSVGVSGLSSGVPRLLLFDEPPPSLKSAPTVSLASAIRSGTKAQPTEVPLATRRELYAAAAATVFSCDACGKDCSRMRYNCVAQVDLDLCPACFADGQYPNMLSTRDFEQLTTVANSDAYDGSVWSETEVLLLLEGLEKFGDDWNAVAAHVKTKSNEQCVMHFLKMPIEDSFLGDQIGKWGRGGSGGASENAASGDHVFSGAPLPFADAANPVMAQIAFLAASVSPEVAAAAAQAALCKIMSETDPNIGNVAPTDSQRAQLAGSLLGSNSTNTDAAGAASEFKASNPVLPNGTAPPANGTPAPSQAAAPSQLGAAPVAGEQRAVPVPGTELDAASVQASAAVALAAAAARARVLADAEVREIERQFAIAIETKLGLIEEKMLSFARMEEMVRSERDRLEQERQIVYRDRISAALARAEVEKAQPKTVNPPPVSEPAPIIMPTLPVMQGNHLNHVPGFATAAAVTSTGLGPQSGLPPMAGQYPFAPQVPVGGGTGTTGTTGSTLPPVVPASVPTPTESAVTAPGGGYQGGS